MEKAMRYNLKTFTTLMPHKTITTQLKIRWVENDDFSHFGVGFFICSQINDALWSDPHFGFKRPVIEFISWRNLKTKNPMVTVILDLSLFFFVKQVPSTMTIAMEQPIYRNNNKCDCRNSFFRIKFRWQ